MVDTVLVGGVNYSTDDITVLNGVAVTAGSNQTQRLKMQFGDDGTARDVSAAFPMPAFLPDVVATGTITANDALGPAPSGTGVLNITAPSAGSFVAMALPGGDSAWIVQVTGTFGGGTIVFGCSADSTNGVNGSWSTLSLRTIGTTTTVIGDTTTIAGLFRGNASGMTWVRVRVTGATTPSIAVVLRATDAVGPVALNAPLPTGANSIGTVQQAALTKGTQGATGVTSQDLKDAGRTPVTYYTLIPVLTSATDTLQSLTGTKTGATVAATITPAVVTAGKTFRVQRFAATYISTAASGYGVVRLRYNTAGVVAITSPVLLTIAVGSGSPTTANAADTEDAAIPDGLEVPAGAGIGVSVQGFAAVTPTAAGYVLTAISGYEY